MRTSNLEGDLRTDSPASSSNKIMGCDFGKENSSTSVMAFQDAVVRDVSETKKDMQCGAEGSSHDVEMSVNENDEVRTGDDASRREMSDTASIQAYSETGQESPRAAAAMLRK